MQLHEVQISMWDSRRIKNKCVNEQTSEEKAESLEQNQRRYAAGQESKWDTKSS